MSTLTHQRKWTIAVVSLLLQAGLVVALDDFAIDRCTIDGGGVMRSTGGDFEDFADPEGTTASGSVMATDVTCSNNVVAFRALRQEDDGLGCSTRDEWVVGFILLDRLED